MMTSRSSRSTVRGRRWPRLAVVFAGLLALVVGVSVYFAVRPAPTPAPADAAPAPAAPPAPAGSPAVRGAPTVVADGCLGGTDPVKAIRVAHAKAPLTPEGAAAFVATLARWQGQAPHDPGEFQETGKLIWAPSLPAVNRKMPPAPVGATAWVSTDDARYRVTDVSGPDVTIEAFFTQTVVQDGETIEAQHVARFTVTAIDGHWALKSVAAGDQAPEQLIAELQAEGLPYRGGC